MLIYCTLKNIICQSYILETIEIIKSIANIIDKTIVIKGCILLINLSVCFLITNKYNKDINTHNKEEGKETYLPI